MNVIKTRKNLIFICFLAHVLGFVSLLAPNAFIGSQAQAAEEKMTEIKDPENTLIMTTSKGEVVIALRPDLAPNHVTRIKELTREGFYDGIVFHRVIDGFMAQTGDPTGTGMGGSGQNLDAEFSSEKHVRGTVSMARAADPNSADSQFFIVYEEAPWLNKQYTVWGEVISGMDAIDELEKGEPVPSPDKIEKMIVAADKE